MKKSSLICLLSTAMTIKETMAIYGMDIGDKVYNNWSCLKQNGIDFAIPRAWHSYGAFDTDIIDNVSGAKAAGLEYVDVYLFPCRSKSATD